MTASGLDVAAVSPSAFAVGVDIGETSVTAGVVAADGMLVDQTCRATDTSNAVSIEASVVACVDQLRENYRVGAVGLAATGFVTPDRRAIHSVDPTTWREFPLADRLEMRLELPVVIENHANAAALAEYVFGAGRNAHTMVMLRVGNGLCGAVITGGIMLRGAFGATEMGHMKLVVGGHHCSCGHEGCWEAYASGTALEQSARHAVRAHPDIADQLLQVSKGRPPTDIDVAQAADQDDFLAQELLGRLGTWLGYGLATVAAVVDPDVIVLGGGLAYAADHFLPPARQAFQDHLSARGRRGLATIVTAEHGSNGGMIGAAASASTTLATNQLTEVFY